MFSQSWLNLGLLACSVLLPVQGRKKMWELSVENAKIGENYMNAQFSSMKEAAANTTRYLNAKTKPYQITSLPEINFALPEIYSGSIPIDASNPNRTLFFVFQPKLGDPVDEVTIWLNGGPGCSSLAGWIQENGQFTWQPGTFLPVRNRFAWSQLTNMLWVEQPVGTGFTQGKSGFTTQEETAKEFIGFFKNFQKKFGIKNYKIYVTGESYAGRYVPYIGAAMLNAKDQIYYNLKGAMVYDPVIGQFLYTQSQVPIYPFIEANNNLFNFNQSFLDRMGGLHQECGYANILKKYYKFPPPGHQPPAYFDYNNPRDLHCDIFDRVDNEALRINSCFNIYAVNQQCPLLWSVLSFPTQLFYTPKGAVTYFNRPDVKEALHAPDTEWTICDGPIYTGGGGSGGPEQEGDLSKDPIQEVLPQVIEATNRVLVANGNFDMIILTQGTLLSIQNMTWNGKIGFQSEPTTPINIQTPDLQYRKVFRQNGAGSLVGPQGNMGVQHYERGLLWATTDLAGHMVPQFQQRSAYRHLQWLLGHIDTL